MIAVRVFRSLAPPLGIALSPRIVGPVSTPMQCGADDVVSHGILLSVIASRLCNVNLATAWPFAIDGILGHHPDGGPHPITSGHFGDDFHSAIPDGLFAGSGEASRAHRVDHCSLGLIAPDRAGMAVLKPLGNTLLTAGAGPICCQIDGITNIPSVSTRLVAPWIQEGSQSVTRTHGRVALV